MPTTIGVQEVIDAYNGFLDPSAPVWQRKNAGRPDDAQAVVAFLKWCVEHEVHNPLLFMRIRFHVLRTQRRTRSAAPGLSRLATPTLLTKYRAAESQAAQSQHAREHIDEEAIRSFIQVNRGHEAVRADYLARHKTHLCVVQPALSGGYHPHSQFCPVCPNAVQCAAELNEREGFDVVALRLGKLDELPEYVRKAVGG